MIFFYPSMINIIITWIVLFFLQKRESGFKGWTDCVITIALLLITINTVPVFLESVVYTFEGIGNTKDYLIELSVGLANLAVVPLFTLLLVFIMNKLISRFFKNSNKNNGHSTNVIISIGSSLLIIVLIIGDACWGCLPMVFASLGAIIICFLIDLVRVIKKDISLRQVIISWIVAFLIIVVFMIRLDIF